MRRARSIVHVENVDGRPWVHAATDRSPGIARIDGRGRTETRARDGATEAGGMKRPGVASTGASTGASTTAGASTGTGTVKVKVEKTRRARGGLLASILGDVKRSNEARKRTLEASGGRAVTRDEVVSREAEAARARKRFEDEVRGRLEREIGTAASEEAFCEFAPMEKQWRSVVHEIATEMQMFSESVEVGESGDKFVIVHKREPRAEEASETARDAAAARERAMKPSKKGEALSDKAPTFAGDDVELTVVGTVKRDLRSVEETIADMRKAKEAKHGE